MSLHYDIFIKCDLKENVPKRVIDGIRYLIEPDFKLSQPVETEGQWVDYWENWGQMLMSEPKLETFSNLHKQERFQITITPNQKREPIYHYSLMYYGHHILDDIFYEEHLPFLAWLAQYTVEGFIGYYKEELSNKPELIYVEQGKLSQNDVNSHR